ncbi:tripartite tricarboxylate transporter TctB family protein [Cellulosilyticum sp. I15G10I2]|uniref:tripartite tricarboxylate transporter TctB family protein n=1 Tax=Cellulosilyticum sp. I15G10I2 TaxID=1892843 RepID=UPI0014961F67|nr:tripartite tricarboxylate transporter TctB family protein [Cellulosilyticum sp. I15G10I2]
MKKDRLVGIGAILAAIFFFYHTGSIKVPDNIVDPGPRLLPYLAEALMVICGIGMIVESEIKNKEEKAYLTKDGWKRMGIAFGVLIAYAIALTYIGFLWATPFMAFVLINMLSGEKKVSLTENIILSIVITAGLYLMFAKGFGVMLPQGKF